MYNTIGVMDTDGTHQTNVYIAGASSETDRYPTWSSSNSIAWSKNQSAIVAEDIAVGSNGVPVASNLRTITTRPADSFSIVYPVWSTTSGTNRLAFVTYNSSGASQLYTVSASGSAWMLFATVSGSSPDYWQFDNPTWSPDDSKIAVLREPIGGGGVILIFDASTGAAIDSIALPSTVHFRGALEWSRGTLNELVFQGQPSGSSSWYLYYAAATGGATVSTNNVAMGPNYSAWSPNNSGILFANGSLKKLTPFTTTVTTIASSFAGSWPNWHQ